MEVPVLRAAAATRAAKSRGRSGRTSASPADRADGIAAAAAGFATRSRPACRRAPRTPASTVVTAQLAGLARPTRDVTAAESDRSSMPPRMPGPDPGAGAGRNCVTVRSYLVHGEVTSVFTDGGF